MRCLGGPTSSRIVVWEKVDSRRRTMPIIFSSHDHVLVLCKDTPNVWQSNAICCQRTEYRTVDTRIRTMIREALEVRRPDMHSNSGQCTDIVFRI